MFLTELREKHLVDDAVFPVDSALWPQAALHRHGLDYRYEKHGNRNSVKRVLGTNTSNKPVFKSF